MGDVSAEAVAWIAAGGAVAGALIGSAAGGVVDFLLERQRERRDAKVGARLVRLDLALAADQLKQAEGDGQWWVFFSTSMPGWEGHLASLSARLDERDFEVVTQSVAELQRFGADMKQAPLEPGASFRLVNTPESLKALHKMRVNATKAYNALAKLAKQGTVEGLLHE
jgi:hypothetical protein